jgi:hypothetical protein
MDRTRSTFAALHTPVTSAPRALAICTANVPTPPEAPMISTRCPGCTFPASRTATSAVGPEMGTAAACSNVTFAGLGTSLFALATAYSAKAPSDISTTPTTSSPGRKPVTPAPTAATRPATSRPRTRVRGARMPVTGRIG